MTNTSSATVPLRPALPAAPADVLARLGLLRDLDHPRQAFSYVTPNWFASVMGTGIVAVAAHGLALRVPGLAALALGFWALAAVLLIALTAATVAHWVRHPVTARGHALHPVLAHFYGAPPMAMMTVGAGALLVGHDVLGASLALRLDWVLWSLGTVTGLGAAVVVPYLMFVRSGLRAESAFGGWLMPVVPPMVSASTGALLMPYASPGAGRDGLLLACYVMFAASLAASAVVIVGLAVRLGRREVGEARLVPTVWIVLGPLGQSITAVNLLSSVAHLAVPGSYARVLTAFGVGYGMAVLAVVLACGLVAAAITVRTARDHLPFTLAWWSFVFPVGTVVTGTSALARPAGLEPLRIAAIVLFGALLVAWTTVAARTVRATGRGAILLAPKGDLYR